MEVNSDLRSLKKLYSLLQCTPENVQSITLDQQARIMLKDLLDHATKRVLATHSKIISAQSISLSKSGADSLEKLEATTEMQPSPNLQNASSAIIQASRKASLFQKLFLIIHLFLLFYMPILTLLRYLWNPRAISAKDKEQPSPKGVAANADNNRKFESSNKLCQTCGKRSMKRTNSIAERTISVEKSQNPVRDCDDQSSLLHFQGSIQPVKSLRRLASSQSFANQVKHCSLGDMDEISREASEQIDQIDSCLIGPVTEEIEKEKPHKPMKISDAVSPIFQTSNCRQSQADNTVQIGNFTPNPQLDCKLYSCRLASAVPSRSYVSENSSMERRELWHKNRKLLSRQSSQNRRDISKKTDGILSRIPSQKLSQVPGKKFSEMVENTSVASHNKNYDKGLSMLPYQGDSVKETRDQITRAQDERASNVKTYMPSLQPRRSGHTKSKALEPSYKLDWTSTSGYNHREYNPCRPMIVRPMLLDGSASVTKGSHAHECWRSAKFRHFSEEYVGSSTPSSSSSSSSSWMTQQSNGSCTESEGQSYPGKLMHKNITSESVRHFSEESTASLSNSFTSSYTSERASSTSCSGDKGHSLQSRWTNETDSSSSSSFNTAYSKDTKLQRRVGSKRQLIHRKSPINPIGRFRGIKNKLGLIFHHHHHHHHHHNDNRVHRHSSQRKDEGKNLYRSNKDHNHAVKKDGRSKGSIVPSKQREGNFRALVEGLMRHIRQSKRPKKFDKLLLQLKKGRHGYQKAAKKLNYWQVLRQNGGVMLPQKSRVKLHYAGQKS